MDPRTLFTFNLTVDNGDFHHLREDLGGEFSAETRARHSRAQATGLGAPLQVPARLSGRRSAGGRLPLQTALGHDAEAAPQAARVTEPWRIYAGEVRPGVARQCRVTAARRLRGGPPRSPRTPPGMLAGRTDCLVFRTVWPGSSAAGAAGRILRGCPRPGRHSSTLRALPRLSTPSISPVRRLTRLAANSASPCEAV